MTQAYETERATGRETEGEETASEKRIPLLATGTYCHSLGPTREKAASDVEVALFRNRASSLFYLHPSHDGRPNHDAMVLDVEVKNGTLHVRHRQHLCPTDLPEKHGQYQHPRGGKSKDRRDAAGRRSSHHSHDPSR